MIKAGEGELCLDQCFRDCDREPGIAQGLPVQYGGRGMVSIIIAALKRRSLPEDWRTRQETNGKKIN